MMNIDRSYHDAETVLKVAATAFVATPVLLAILTNPAASVRVEVVRAAVVAEAI